MTTAQVTAKDSANTATSAIERLANSDIPEPAFFQNYLEQVIQSLEATAGAIWTMTPQGLLAKVCEQDLNDVAIADESDLHRANVKWVMDCLKNNQAVIHSSQELGSSNVPKDIIAVMAPIIVDDAPAGLVEVFFRDPKPANDLSGFDRGSFDAAEPRSNHLENLDVLQELCVYATRYLKWRGEASSPSHHLDFWARFERTVASIHQSLDPTEVAATAVNDGRSLLPCDRLSIAIKRGPKTIVQSISGQDEVNRRSNLVRCMEELAAVVIDANKAIRFNGSMDGLAPQITTPLAAYLSESGTRTLKIIPLIEPESSQNSTPAHSKKSQPKPIGALIVEQVTESWITPLMAERAELLAENISTALLNALRHNRLFLLPVWRELGRCLSWFEGRNLFKSLAAVALLAAGIAAMIFVPATYRVEATGKLLPVVRQEVFASVNGEVDEIFVRSGQHVEVGAPLLRLKDEELNTRLLEIRNQLAEKQEQEAALKAEIDSAFRSSSSDSIIKLRGQRAQVIVEIKGLEKRVAALEAQQQALTIHSNIAGTVSTFQLDKLLLHRPVVRGESLLEIMDESGPWQLEVEIPEYRMGHVWDAQAEAASTLPISYVLATAPESTYTGDLNLLATRTVLSEEHGTAVDATVTVDESELPHRKIGAEVSAKIDCGKKNLAYVLFGDVYEYAQRRLW